VAFWRKKLEVVRSLPKNGADPNTAIADAGRTPLHTAAEQGLLEIVRCLIAGGADVKTARSDRGAAPSLAPLGERLRRGTTK
jgi:ankyrin repeat protein